MWAYEVEYESLEDKEKIKRLETLCKTYIMYLDIKDKKHPNIFMKDATIFWEGFEKENI